MRISIFRRVMGAAVAVALASASVLVGFGPAQAAPGDPVVVTNPAPISDQITSTFLVQGTGWDGATLVFTDDGDVIGSTVVPSGGAWELLLWMPGNDTYDRQDVPIVVTQTPDSGVVVSTATFIVSIVRVPFKITSPEQGSAQTSRTFTVEGEGDQYSYAYVDYGGTTIAFVHMDDESRWSLEVTIPEMDPVDVRLSFCYIDEQPCEDLRVTVPPIPDELVPVNVVLPEITGVPRVGETLAASSGEWAPADATMLTYQWTRGGVAIRGATGATYRVQPGDQAARVGVRVTATRPAGASTTVYAAKVSIALASSTSIRLDDRLVSATARATAVIRVAVPMSPSRAGTATIYVDGIARSTVRISSPVTPVTFPALSRGAHLIKVRYESDMHEIAPSISGSVAQLVN